MSVQANRQPRILYFGTPELAIEPLQTLLDSGAYDICAVVTQTDKPAGRGQQLTPSPLKRFALEKGLQVLQPTNLKKIAQNGHILTLSEGTEATRKFVEFLNAHQPFDAFIVVAYGKIIPSALLRYPLRGIINIHYSLLPHLRGAAPIQRAILRGDTKSGATIMQIDEGLDTGPLYHAAEVDILPDDTSGTLAEKLSHCGSQLLKQILPDILEGTLLPQPQPIDGATYAEKLEKADFRIDWQKSANDILCCIHGACPHPGATTTYQGESVKIFRASKAPNLNYPKEFVAGAVVEANASKLIVATGKGDFLELKEIQFPGKKRLTIADLLRGKSIDIGSLFS